MSNALPTSRVVPAFAARCLHAILLLCGVLALPTYLGAQDVEVAIRPPADETLQRARQLVLDGDATDGRQVLDSVLQANTPDSALYAEALFWRAALAGTAADAERDYKRLLIETPFAPRAEDALLQLAQLEYARGDRSGASDHLQRYMLSYPSSDTRPARPRVALWLVRLLFDQGLEKRGCDAWRMGRDAIPAENLELRNQLEFYSPRCAYADATPATPATSAPAGAPTATPPTDTVTRPAARARRTPAPAAAQRATPPAPRAAQPAATPATPPATTAQPATAPAGSFYSVQVAAYDAPEAAQRMADAMKARGFDARVDGTARPFRVRLGRYRTRAEAVQLAQSLKAQGQNGFVTLVTLVTPR